MAVAAPMFHRTVPVIRVSTDQIVFAWSHSASTGLLGSTHNFWTDRTRARAAIPVPQALRSDPAVRKFFHASFVRSGNLGRYSAAMSSPVSTAPLGASIRKPESQLRRPSFSGDVDELPINCQRLAEESDRPIGLHNADELSATHALVAGTQNLFRRGLHHCGLLIA
jgi:hypothetical protein